MNSKFTKVVVPAVIAISSLGLGAVATLPAGATTTTHAKVATAASVKLTGTVVKADIARGLVWLKVGAKTYRASFTKTTVFTKGTSHALVKGAVISVTGKYIGKSKALLAATSIAA